MSLLEIKLLHVIQLTILNLLCQLASGEVFGPNQPVALKLLGSQRSFQALEGMFLSTCYVVNIHLSGLLNNEYLFSL